MRVLLAEEAARQFVAVQGRCEAEIMRSFFRIGVVWVVVGLLSFSRGAMADGVVVKSRIGRSEVVRRAGTIFTARVLKVRHRRASSPMDPKVKWVDLYRIQVEARTPLRDRHRLAWLFAGNRTFWIEMRNPVVPGVWVAMSDVYRSSYPLWTAKRGDRIVVYLKNFRDIERTGSVHRAQLGWVDHIRAVPEVRRVIKKIEAIRPAGPRTGARQAGPRTQARCPPFRYFFKGKCLRVEAIKRSVRCPVGARVVLDVVRGHPWLGCLGADNKKHGLSVFWHRNRGIFIQDEFRNGKRHGPMIRFHPSGKTAYLVEYADGKRHGSSVEYHVNGRVRVRGEYRMGHRVGRWRYFDPAGRRTETVCFHADRMVWNSREPKVGESRKCPTRGP